MSLSTTSIKSYLIISILTIAVLLISGCSALQSVDQSSGSGQDEAFDEIDLSGDEGNIGSSDGDSANNGSEPAPVMINCPANPMELFLVVNHSWDFSPNRDLEKMRVDGQTGTFVTCPLTVQGKTVTMKDCYFPFTSNGFIQTDDGPCDITTSGDAVLSVEDAYCEDGKITLTIIESMDAGSEPTGAMNCPNKSQPYVPFYPYSLTTRTFYIGVGGSSQTENVDPDLSNQFRYNKEWILFAKDLPAPESGE